MSFPLNQPVRLTFTTFSDAALTTPADPTAITLSIKDPAGIETTQVWPGGNVVKDSTGVFHYDITPTTAGHWSAHWASTGTVTTSGDEDFDVDPKYGTLVSVDDLALYLGNSGIDRDRARMILSLTQTLCESVVTPLPAGSEAVVLDVAERAYANPMNAGGSNLGLYTEGEGPFSDASPGTVGGGLYLTQENKATLRRLNGAGGAFTIDTMPATAGQGLPWWDTAATLAGDWDVPS